MVSISTRAHSRPHEKYVCGNGVSSVICGFGDTSLFTDSPLAMDRDVVRHGMGPNVVCPHRIHDGRKLRVRPSPVWREALAWPVPSPHDQPVGLHPMACDDSDLVARWYHLARYVLSSMATTGQQSVKTKETPKHEVVPGCTMKK